MKGLHDLQRKLQAAVLTGRTANVVDLADLAARAPTDAEARIRIYANAYRLRLIAALREDYPKLYDLLGETAFDRLARAYIERHPSQRPNIRRFGQHLPEFLRERAPFRTNPHLGELAAFERALRDAFDAADAAPLAPEGLAALPPERWAFVRPVLHPSVHRLELRWNSVPIWQALAEDRPPGQPQRATQPIPWVVWRKRLNPHFRSLARDEANALDAVLAGADVQALCSHAAASHTPEEVPAMVARWLAAWLVDEMIVAAD